jgi:phosphoribosylglycinamide formyltransferase 1
MTSAGNPDATAKQARKRTAVLISGRGSNMSVLLAAMANPDFPAQAVLVLSNVASAGGLATAHDAGVLTAVVAHGAFTDRESFDRAVHAELVAHGVELVCLAGFMRMLSPWFCQQWLGRMINIHPSLLPAHKGLHTHRKVLAVGDTVHGCTVHFVTPDLDDGPAILQAKVPVLAGDTEETLAARVLAEEHRIYPLALDKVARGDAKL